MMSCSRFRSVRRAALALMCAILVTGAAQAQDYTDVVVRIECANAKGQPIGTGSGVLLPGSSEILTAGHFLSKQEDAECHGFWSGFRTTTPLEIDFADPTSFAVLRLGEQDVIEKPVDLALCRLGETGDARTLRVAGYISAARESAFNVRDVTISTLRDRRGLLKADFAQLSGMSGAAVFAERSRRLLGIVVGAEIDGLGQVTQYGILPVEEIGGPLRPEVDCFRSSRVVTYDDPTDATWTSGDGTKFLGVGIEEGSCSLASVFGAFDHKDDRVSVDILDGQYAILGTEAGDEPHGGTARCIWFD